MHRGDVCAVPDRSTCATVDLAWRINSACLGVCSVSRQAFFGLERVGRSRHRRCDPGRAHRLLHPRWSVHTVNKIHFLNTFLIRRQNNRRTLLPPHWYCGRDRGAAKILKRRRREAAIGSREIARAAASGGLRLGGIQIFDQENLVAVLRIDELVDQFLRQHDAEPTRTQSLLLA
jgi:hypothetical protein